MRRWRRSVDLAGASWRTLRADRELLALPVFSFVAALVVAGACIGLVVIIDYDPARGFEEFELSAGGIIVMVLAAIVAAIVATYFQAAMVSGAHDRLTGGDPTVSSALAMATRRLNVVVAWALFSWTVGVVLRTIEENAGAVGRFVVGLVGMAFRVVTFMAVPILVVERLGPISTLKRSGTLFRQAWGENLVAQVGLGIVTFVALLPGIVVGVLIGAIVSPLLGIIIAVPWIATVAVVSTSLTAVFQTALYHYATTGEVPGAFAQTDLPDAFRTR